MAALSLAGCGDILPWQSFSIASESMEPTLPVDTIVIGTVVTAADVKRGDILVYRRDDLDWVFRLVGLPGDTVALEAGIVVLNGKAVPQKEIDRYRVKIDAPEDERIVLEEQFPGEAKPHRILDRGISIGDNFEEIVVPAGHYFLLGDNRDNSNDSRFQGGSFGGPGLIRAEQIRKRVDAD